VEGMQFLAKEVARMHKRLVRSSQQEMGTYKSIQSKLILNEELFQRALERLFADNQEQNICLEGSRKVIDVLKRSCKQYEGLFEERYCTGHIKRCHGDLKATNLWIRPFWGLKILRQLPSQLVPLDCIDF